MSALQVPPHDVSVCLCGNPVSLCWRCGPLAAPCAPVSSSLCCPISFLPLPLPAAAPPFPREPTHENTTYSVTGNTHHCMRVTAAG